MVRIISVCSGKGGVGKTTVVTNLGAALNSLGKKTVIVDLNLTTPHLGLAFGFHNPPRTINHFLRKEAGLRDVTYAHRSGLRLVPASLEMNDLANIETENMKEELRKTFKDYDFVLLDSAPGIGKEALIALKACDEALFVANPYIPSVVDVMKLKSLSEKMDFRVTGVVMNRVRKKNYELRNEDVFRFTEANVVGTIPEDEAVLKATNQRNLSIHTFPKSESSKNFMKIAQRLSSGQWW